MTALRYRDDERNHVLRLMEGGITLTTACKILHIDPATVRNWTRSDEDYAARYQRAKENQAHAIADEMLAIADGPASSMEAVQHAKLRIETRKWLLSKWAPKQYAERQQHGDGHQIGVVILPALNLEQKSIKSIAEHSGGSEG